MTNVELIKQLEDEINAKKILVKALRYDQKSKEEKLFAETKFGKVCLQTLQTVTQPFRQLNEDLTLVLNNPVAAKLLSLKTEGNQLICKANKLALEQNTNEATRLANKSAALLLEMKVLLDRRPDLQNVELESFEKDLRVIINKFRPIEQSNILNELTKQINNAVKLKPKGETERVD